MTFLRRVRIYFTHLVAWRISKVVRERQQHGVTAYGNGTCRCARICKPAWAEYTRDRRRAKTGGARRRLRQHVARASVYRDKEAMGIEITELAKQILRKAELVAGENMDDLVERAIRTLGVEGLTAAA